VIVIDSIRLGSLEYPNRECAVRESSKREYPVILCTVQWSGEYSSVH
jgi:hypothetical protein